LDERRAVTTTTTATTTTGTAAETEVHEGQFVTLVSSDEHEFIVSRKCATGAGTIKSMLNGPGQFVEKDRNEVAFREIPAYILERVCVYLYYKNRYAQRNQETPEFVIEPATVLELLMAANFLDA